MLVSVSVPVPPLLAGYASVSERPVEANCTEPPLMFSVTDVVVVTPGKVPLGIGVGDPDGPGTEFLWQPLTTNAAAQTRDHATRLRLHRFIMRSTMR